MPRGTLRAGILLLVVLFVGAQFHFCADLTAPSGPHFCPVCSTTGFAMAAEMVSIPVAAVAHRLESVRSLLHVSNDVPSAISPRAPPSLDLI
jgi:hypothetical protein